MEQAQVDAILGKMAVAIEKLTTIAEKHEEIKRGFNRSGAGITMAGEIPPMQGHSPNSKGGIGNG
jgi:hypothetical protein